MKISLCLSYSSIISIINILFAMQLLIFFFSPRNSEAFAHNEPPHMNGFGGLKWTRTIDLTLIRRVL